MEENTIWDRLEQNYWLVIGVSLLVIALITGRNHINDKRKQQVNDFILTNITIEDHAWNGIVVAETREEDVERLLSNLEYVKKSSIETVTTNNFTYINWSWNTSPNITNSSIRCQNGFVDRIILAFADELKIESMIPTFGFPDDVYSSPVGETTEPIFWNLTLYYLAEGLNIGTTSRHPQKNFSFSDRVEMVELFAPEQITSAQDLAFVYGIDIRDIVAILPAWIPTKDKQLFESYLQLFRQTDRIPYGPHGAYETSGIALGMFIVENEIKILRDGTTYDGEGSLIECPSNSYGCSFRSSLDPNQNHHIFVNGLQAASLSYHTGTIAHEAFHLTSPFGTLQNSLYEEMTAIAIGYVTSGGENRGMYISAAPLNLTSLYSETDIISYITAYCGETCSYLELPTYPDTWETVLQTVESEKDD